MKKLILFSSMCLAGVSAFALPDYDPFADATGAGGTAYTVGANLIGQKNAQGSTWFQAGPTGTQPQPTIVSGNLSVTGLATSTGNSISYGNANGDTARLNVGSTINSGTIYFSMAIDVTGLGGLSTGGAIIAGFNNSSGSQATQPSVIGTPLEVRLSGSGYNIGVAKSASQTISWDSGVNTVGQTIFVVGSYTFVAGANVDTVSLWINPSSATFGAGSAPTASLTTTVGSNINATDQIASFLIREASTLEPVLTADDVRLGLNWADVTPAATIAPEPTSLMLGGLGIVALIAVRRVARK